MHHFNEAVSRIEGNLGNRVTKDQLELAEKRIQNEQLKSHNEFLRITRPEVLELPKNRHTGR
jgi:hypothetical protein